MAENDENVYRLDGSKEEAGGLIIKKKPAPIESFEFKKPSLFGLDKLAGKISSCDVNIRALIPE